MTDRLFTDCCYGTDQQHTAQQECPQTYRGWTIRYDPPPIPIRNFDWQATGPNYDASYEGEEDGWVDNGEKAEAATREELIALIDGHIAEAAR